MFDQRSSSALQTSEEMYKKLSYDHLLVLTNQLFTVELPMLENIQQTGFVSPGMC